MSHFDVRKSTFETLDIPSNKSLYSQTKIIKVLSSRPAYEGNGSWTLGKGYKINDGDIGNILGKTLGIWRKYGKSIENSFENKMGTHWEHQNLKGGMDSLFYKQINPQKMNL